MSANTRASSALLLFAGSAIAFLVYTHYSTKEVKKTRNSSLGSNQQLTSEVIAKAVTALYGLQAPTVTLIRAGFNHNYLVETAVEKHVLRVYLNNKYYIRDSDDFRFELELTQYLKQQEGPVVGVVPNVSTGDLLSVVNFDEAGDLQEEEEAPHRRYVALFEYALGEPVSHLNRASRGQFMGPSQLYSIGVLMAQLHQAADNFPNPNQYHRYHQDTSTYLLDQPLQRLVTWGFGGKLDFFEDTARYIRSQIQQLPRTQPVYGIIHGDFQSANLFCRVEQKQFTVIDWDHCSYGYRVYEFAWLSKFLPAASFEALVKGYESVRRLTPPERKLIPIFALLRDLWDIGDYLAFAPLWAVDRRPTRGQLNRYFQRLHETKEKIEELQEKDRSAVPHRSVPVAPVPPDPLPSPAPAPAPFPAPVQQNPQSL